MPRIVKILLFILINLLAVEAALRVQQEAGPLVDLEMSDIGADRISRVLNHVPPRTETLTLADADVFGPRAGLSYTVTRDARGVRRNALRTDPGPDAPSVLVLGDSFAEGYDDAHTLVQIVARTLDPEGRIRWLNAGHSSYSPAIFVAQARLLLPEYRPDAVVVVIDQTDLGDDVLRYEHLLQRDDAGRITAVAPSPPMVEFYRGLAAAAASPSYLVRILKKAYHTRVRMPRVRREYRALRPGGMRQYSRNPAGGAELYPDELAIFTRNLDELLDVLIPAVGGPGNVLLVSHPHIHHLVPDADGLLWRDLVGPAVRAAAERRGVRCYLAGPDLAREFGGAPERYYWHGDMHFNFEGFRIYGERLAPHVAALPPVRAALAAD